MVRTPLEALHRAGSQQMFVWLDWSSLQSDKELPRERNQADTL